MFSEKAKRQWRGSRDGGHRRPPGSAQLPSLSLDVRWIMEPSSSGPETAGCARTWTPARCLHLQLLYYTSYCGQRCKCNDFLFFENMIQATHRFSPDQTPSLLTEFDKTRRLFVLYRIKNSKAYYYVYFYILHTIAHIPLAAPNPWFDVLAPKLYGRLEISKSRLPAWKCLLLDQQNMKLLLFVGAIPNPQHSQFGISITEITTDYLEEWWRQNR